MQFLGERAVLLALTLALETRAKNAGPCAELATTYAHRHPILNEVVNGNTTPCVHGASRESHVAAAALLHAVIRHVLGYNATLYNCSLNSIRVVVAPVVTYNCNAGCSVHYYGNEVQATPSETWLMAHVPGDCCESRAGCDDGLQDCNFIKLNEFQDLKLSSACGAVRSHDKWCSVSSQDLAVLVPPIYSGHEIVAFQEHNCGVNFPLSFIRFDDISCYRCTIELLIQNKISFYFLDHFSDLLPVDLYRRSSSRDPRISKRKIKQCAIGVNKNTQRIRSAQPIADIIQRFNYPVKDFEIVNTEKAACSWALNNKRSIESWITAPIFNIFIFMCNDTLATHYQNTIAEITITISNTLPFQIQAYDVFYDCSDDIQMYETYSEVINSIEFVDKGIGVVTLNSNDGISKKVQHANDNQIPLIVVGPTTSEILFGTTTGAVGGRLEDLAKAYRTFLNNCQWTRLAILSDKTKFATTFKNALLDKGGIIYTEKFVMSETIKMILISLKKEDARIFILNTNTTLAEDILSLALHMNMTPKKGYSWIVREWSPAWNHNATSQWSAMRHFSLSMSWRGEGSGFNSAVIGGDASLRAQLDEYWPQAAWPALAAPLADAILVLCHRFSALYHNFSSNSITMLRDGYNINFSRVYDEINVTGLTGELKFDNGIVRTTLVYLEQWQGDRRSVLASWHVQNPPFKEHNFSICGAPRVSDRSWCLISEGGSQFVRKCYDPPLYALAVVLVLLPALFYLVKRMRRKRFEERDRNLVATLLGNKQSLPMINKVFLHKHEVIGTGNFGRVYLASLKQSTRKSVFVAAKELWKDGDKKEYLQEARTLELLNHKNIVKFLGICLANGSLVILMEYALYGDLLQYLQARRHLAEQGCGASSDSEAVHVSAEALTRLAGEATAALEYLAHRSLVHRDVRAANCLIDMNRTLKLADFGMARKLDTDQQDYTTIRTALFPVVWMAPESLNYGIFSTASDMWGLGLLFLQLSTLGRRPYGEWPPYVVVEFVRLGGHAPLPPDISPETRSLVAACWQREAAARPSASDVLRYLARNTRALRPALQPAPAPCFASRARAIYSLRPPSAPTA